MPIIDGKLVRARYTKLRLDELSAVDDPAQPGALAAITKRHDPLAAIAELEIAKYIDTEDGAHTFREALDENKFSEAIWPLTSALQQSIRSIIGDRSIDAMERDQKITTSVQQFLAAVRDIDPSVEKQLKELISRKESTMPKTVEQLEAEVTDLTAKNATLETEKAAAAKMAEDEKKAKEKAEDEAKAAKAELESLKSDANPDAKKLAEVTAERDDLAKQLTAATDETVTVGGEEIRKSVVGEASFKVVKATAKERDLAKFEKRAETDYAHVPGTAVEKALVLEHVDAMPDEAKKAMQTILDSSEKMIAQGFNRIGEHGGATPTQKAAVQAFEKRIDEIQKRDDCKRADAMSKARREFPDEFAAYNEGAAPAN